MDNQKRIFISYRRDTGSPMARMIHDRLKFERGLDCFLDVEKLSAGNFHENIEREISNSDIFILVLSKNALDRCSNKLDNVRQEIETAMRFDLAFIPVTSEDFIWPDVMPEGLEDIKSYNAIPYVQVYSDNFFDRLYGFIRSIRMESAVGKQNLIQQRSVISPGASPNMTGPYYNTKNDSDYNKSIYQRSNKGNIQYDSQYTQNAFADAGSQKPLNDNYQKASTLKGGTQINREKHKTGLVPIIAVGLLGVIVVFSILTTLLLKPSVESQSINRQTLNEPDVAAAKETTPSKNTDGKAAAEQNNAKGRYGHITSTSELSTEVLNLMAQKAIEAADKYTETWVAGYTLYSIEYKGNCLFTSSKKDYSRLILLAQFDFLEIDGNRYQKNYAIEYNPVILDENGNLMTDINSYTIVDHETLYGPDKRYHLDGFGDLYEFYDDIINPELNSGHLCEDNTVK